MKFAKLKQHLESCPGVAGATRAAWEGKAFVAMGHNGFLFLQIDMRSYLYAFGFEDAMADDWEPV